MALRRLTRLLLRFRLRGSRPPLPLRILATYLTYSTVLVLIGFMSVPEVLRTGFVQPGDSRLPRQFQHLLGTSLPRDL